MPHDSPNVMEDKDERPEGLCKTCEFDCYSDWVIVLCDKFKESK
jgi:hypothetical protein